MSESKTKTIQVIGAVQATDLSRYYTVQVWKKRDFMFVGVEASHAWHVYGLQSETLDGISDVYNEAMDVYAKVRVVRTANEVIDTYDL